MRRLRSVGGGFGLGSGATQSGAAMLSVASGNELRMSLATKLAAIRGFVGVGRRGSPALHGAAIGAPGAGIGGGASGPGELVSPVGGADAIGYRPAPLSEAPPGTLQYAASERWVRRIVDTVNNSLRGKLNVTLGVTLTANAGSTIILDARISAFSALVFMPLSANAAAEQAAGTMYVSAQKTGQATITHANNTQSDRAFRLIVLA
jgi:hypothetical protein